MGLKFQKVETKLHFKEEKPTVYKIQQVSQDPVDYDRLLDEVSNSCGMNRAMVAGSVEGLIDRLCHYIDLGLPVQLGGFGTFKPVFTSKTKKTADELGSDNVTNIKFRFYPGKKLRKTVKNLSVTEMSFSDNLLDDEEDDTTPGGTNPDDGSDGGGQEFT